MNYQIIPGLILSETAKWKKPEMIKKAVCHYFNLTEEQMFNRSRRAKYIEPRRVCVYLLRSLTKLSLKEIAEECGGYTHANIIHLVRTCRNLVDTEPEIRNQVHRIHELID